VISYLDTSLLMKLYVFEAESARAASLAQDTRYGPAISRLSEVEMAAGLHAKSAESLPEGIVDKAYEDFRKHVSAGVYTIVPIDSDIFDLAQRLGEKHGRQLRVRTLDILHVAAALRFGAVAFGTFDQRQARLAHAVGLKMLK
jgi:predicted nucleic acid-binding protein